MLKSLLEVLDKIGVKIEEIDSFLEFACGYGRFTRHLVKIIPPQKITGSDVYKEAVDFQKKMFGVKGFYSGFNPDDITIPEKYDVIFVASLFSHLPLKTWRPWLKKLYQSLNENGVLIFSTHGKSCLVNPSDMPDNGFLYSRVSESKIHSYDDYGATYVTSAFVHKAIMEETGQFVLLEVPKCLWNYQDIYIIKRPEFF
jgi:SAM-dependent methyltransferase